MLLRPGSLLQGFHLPQPCYASSSPRALRMFTFQKIALLRYRCLLRRQHKLSCSFIFPRLYCQKQSAESYMCVKCSPCLALSGSWERCCLYRWTGMYQQPVTQDRQQVSGMVGADWWRRKLGQKGTPVLRLQKAVMLGGKGNLLWPFIVEGDAPKGSFLTEQK